MKKTIKKGLKFTIECLVGLIVIILVIGGLTAWRLSQGPVNMDIAVPYFIDYFNKANTEQVDMDSLVLQWDGWDNPLGLSARNVVISNERGPFLFSPEIDLNIGIAPLLWGKLDLQTVWIRQIALSVTKQADGQFTLTGQSASEDSKPEDMTPARLTLNDFIYDLPELDSFWLDEATITYKDEVKIFTRQLEPVTLYIGVDTQRNQRHIEGFLSLPVSEDEGADHIRLKFETVRDPLLLDVTGGFEQTPLADFLQFAPDLPEGLDLDMTVDADIRFQLDNLFRLHAMDAVITAENGTVTYPLNAETDSIALESITLETTLNPKNNILKIKRLDASLNGEVPFSVSGDLTSINSTDKLAGDITLNVTDLPQSYFDRYWPADHTDNGAYKWLTQKIEDGRFPDVTFEGGFDLAKADADKTSPLPPWIRYARGSFSFEDLTIDYNDPMAKGTDVNGTGTYNNIEMKLDVTEADIGGMKIADATLHFDDLITKGSGLGTLTFPMTAQAQQVFDYIAAPPINAFDTIDFKPQNTQGEVEATVSILIPLLKGVKIDDVDVTVKGTVTDASIPNAVRGLTLSGGPYTIEATKGDIKVDGSGQIAGQPITLNWHEYFSARDDADYLSSINATVTANDTIRQAFIEDIAEHFTGSAIVKMAYLSDKNGRDTSLKLMLDLKDTAISVDKIGLNKQAGAAANATLDVSLVNGTITAIDNFTIKGDALSLAKGSLRFRNRKDEPIVTRIDFDDLVYGDNRFTLDAAEEDGLLKADIKGRYIDIRPLLKGDKQELEKQYEETRTVSRPMEIGMTVNEMQTAENATLKQPKLYARLNASGQIEQFELDGTLGETGQSGRLRVRYTPEDVEDGLSLRVESNNAGEVLRTFDLYPNIRGGTLQIAGKPKVGGRFGDVRGRARINNFEVKDAPVLVRLLNALSFENFLQAGTLGFTRLESDFEWQIGQGGDIYKVENGRTSGASIALTFDGYVNTETDDMNISGTAAPLSALNNMIRNIPIVGQLLTGGGAFLAATYTITGDPSDPTVGVNPLSVLAPGIVRRMLFENTPTPDDRPEQDRPLN